MSIGEDQKVVVEEGMMAMRVRSSFSRYRLNHVQVCASVLKNEVAGPILSLCQEGRPCILSATRPDAIPGLITDSTFLTPKG